MKQPTQPIRETLIVKKEQFEKEINVFIDNGSLIQNIDIKHPEQLLDAERQYDTWIGTISEFLKSSFNVPKSTYLLSFSSAGDFNYKDFDDVWNWRVDPDSFTFRRKKIKDRIQAKIDNLKDLLQKIKYIPLDNSIVSETIHEDEFSETEKSEIISKIDEIVEKLKLLGYGQEIIFEEIEELKNLNMSKKTWNQVLKGKLIDLGVSTLLSKETISFIYKSLTNDNTNILGN